MARVESKGERGARVLYEVERVLLGPAYRRDNDARYLPRTTAVSGVQLGAAVSGKFRTSTPRPPPCGACPAWRARAGKLEPPLPLPPVDCGVALDAPLRFGF